jgi:hypothetical protein
MWFTMFKLGISTNLPIINKYNAVLQRESQTSLSEWSIMSYTNIHWPQRNKIWGVHSRNFKDDFLRFPLVPNTSTIKRQRWRYCILTSCGMMRVLVWSVIKLGLSCQHWVRRRTQRYLIHWFLYMMLLQNSWFPHWHWSVLLENVK